MNDETIADSEAQEAPQEDTATSEAEQAAPVAEADSDSGSEEKSKDQPEKTPKPRRNRRSEGQRIAQLTAQLREREREIAAIQAKAETLPLDAPKRDDFDDYEEYLEAKAEHKAVQAVEKRLQETEARFKERETQTREALAQQQAEAARDSLMDSGAEKYPDFEAVTTHDDLHISEVMADEILASKQGDDVWYHLGKHPDEAERIASLDARAQIRAIAKLETQLSGGKVASNTLPPIKPVNSRGPSNNGLSDKLSVKDWMKRRNEEVRKHSF